MRTTHRFCMPPARVASAALLAVGLAMAAATASLAAAPTTEPPKRAATSAVATDDDDAYGRLDIASVGDRVTQVDAAHTVLTFRVTTYAPFDSSRLDGANRYFRLDLDRDGERGAERMVLIARHHEAVQATVISLKSGRVIATLPASRPSDDAVAITGSRRILGAHTYAWRSDFHAERSRHCGWSGGVPEICHDDAPDHGWLRLQRLAWPDAG